MKAFLKISGLQDAIELLESLSIGRKEGSLVFKEDQKLSGKHLNFYLKDGKCFVEDLGSSNGTWVNEVRLEKKATIELKNGDQIKCGNQEVSLLVELPFESDHSDLDPEKTKIEIPISPEHPEFAETSKITTEFAPLRSALNSSKTATRTQLKTRSGQNYINSSVPWKNLALVAVLIGLAFYYLENEKKSISSEVGRFSEKAITQQASIQKEPERSIKKTESQFLTTLTKKRKQKNSAPKNAQVPSVAQKRSNTKSALRVHTEMLRAKYRKAMTRGMRQALVFQAKDYAENYFAAERRKIVKDFNQRRFPASELMQKKESTERKLEAMRNREQAFMDALIPFFQGGPYVD